ncbi:HAD family hydrolase domain-containing protein [Candidatus Hepatincolaceae symbiont of Richtersius coronifer]
MKLKMNNDNWLTPFEIISFNIFDTVILRPYNKPTDLFKHIDYQYSKGFFSSRITAETLARQRLINYDKKDVTLDEIYAYINPQYYDLKQLEIDWEIKISSKNSMIYPIYQQAIAANKIIVFVSQTSLPLKVVEKMLNNNGYGKHKIYLSSHLNLSKSDGSIFKKLKQDFYDKKILHIGDNLHEDIISAANWGIEAQYYPKPSEYFLQRYETSPFLKKISKLDSLSASITIGLNVVNWLNQYFVIDNYKENFIANFGSAEAWYNLMPFVQWFYQQIKINFKNPKIYFLSRESEIIRQIYQLLYPQEEIRYLEFNKRLAIILNIENSKEDGLEFFFGKILGEDLSQLLKKPNAMEIIYARLGLDLPIFLNRLKILNLSSDDDLDHNKQILISLLLEYQDDILLLLKGEQEHYIRYLTQEGLFDELNQPIILIDLDCNGIAQQTLHRFSKKIFPKLSLNLHGYYFSFFNSSNIIQINNYHSFINEYEFINDKHLLDMSSFLEIIGGNYQNKNLLKIYGENDWIYRINHNKEDNFDINKHLQKGVSNLTFLYNSLFSNQIMAFDKLVLDQEKVSIFENANHPHYSWLANICKSGEENSPPLVNRGLPCIIISYPWNDNLSAELELIKRLSLIEEALGIPIYVMNQNYYFFDKNHKLTNLRYNRDYINVLFHIDLFITSFKSVDTLSIQWMALLSRHIADHLSFYPIQTHDIYVHNGSDINSNFIKQLVNKYKKFFSKEWELYPTNVESSILPPNNFINPSIYYAATQWELSKDNNARHSSLLSLLDKSEIPCGLYGPKLKHNKSFWNSLRKYKGVIPFDGKSMHRVLNQAGIALCFSSRAHLEAQSVSSRLYETISGGAIVISDYNQFIINNFGNSVLYIDINMSDEAILDQISTYFYYIKNNPEIAKNMVIKTQEILREKFIFEKQIQHWIGNIEEVKEHIKENKSSITDDKIDIILIIINHEDINNVQEAINNIIRQTVKNIRVICICDSRYQILLERLFDKILDYIIVPIKNILDKNFNRFYYIGELLSLAAPYVFAPYFYIYIIDKQVKCDLYCNHLSYLKRALEDNPEAMMATSRSAIDYGKGTIELYIPPSPEYISSLASEKIYQINTVFKKEVLINIDKLIQSLDQLTILFLLINNKNKIVFLPEVLCSINIKPDYNSVNINKRGDIKSEKLIIKLLLGVDLHLLNNVDLSHSLKIFPQRYLLNIVIDKNQSIAEIRFLRFKLLSLRKLFFKKINANKNLKHTILIPYKNKKQGLNKIISKFINCYISSDKNMIIIDIKPIVFLAYII